MVQTRKNSAALLEAAAESDTVAARAAIAAGADVNCVDRRDGYTPLNIAVERGDIRMARVILDAGAAPLGGIINNLEYSVEKGMHEILRLLLSNGANPNGWNVPPADTAQDTPLMLAAERGDGEMVRQLLKAGADPNRHDADGKTALDIARRRKRREAIELLKSVTAKLPRSSGRRAQTRLRKAMKAVEMRREIEAIELIDEGIDLNRVDDFYGETMVTFAAQMGLISVVQKLLKIGADPNAKGMTPAIVGACSGDNVELLELLIEFGADPNASTPDGSTALMAAAVRGLSWQVQRLIWAGANVAHRNANGETALDRVIFLEPHDGRRNPTRPLLERASQGSADK